MHPKDKQIQEILKEAEDLILEDDKNAKRKHSYRFGIDYCERHKYKIIIGD